MIFWFTGKVVVEKYVKNGLESTVLCTEERNDFLRCKLNSRGVVSTIQYF